jgi:carbonic anhydrase
MTEKTKSDSDAPIDESKRQTYDTVFDYLTTKSSKSLNKNLISSHVSKNQKDKNIEYSKTKQTTNSKNMTTSINSIILMVILCLLNTVRCQNQGPPICVDSKMHSPIDVAPPLNYRNFEVELKILDVQ